MVGRSGGTAMELYQESKPVRGVLGPGKVTLICYERPLRAEGRSVR